MVPDPVLLIEILSPSNEAQTRANIWAYTTIPSVQEILAVHSTRIEAELLRRGGDGNWPEAPEIVTGSDTLRLASIGFATALVHSTGPRPWRRKSRCPNVTCTRRYTASRDARLEALFETRSDGSWRAISTSM